MQTGFIAALSLWDVRKIGWASPPAEKNEAKKVMTFLGQ